MPLISVVITVYNKEPFLKKCLDSVINQTLTDIEIICVDDGSTDNSLEILHQFSSKDKRINVISQENSGQSAARNKGLFEANGEYVIFIDADDYAELNMLENMYNAAKEFGADTVICGFNQFNDKEIIPHTGLDSLLEKTPISKQDIDEIIVKNLFTLKVAAGVHNRIFLREMLINNNILFDTTLLFMEDYLYNVDVCNVSNCQVILHDKYYYYRTASDGTVSTGISIQKLNSFLDLYTILKTKISCNISKEFDFWAFFCLYILTCSYFSNANKNDFLSFCRCEKIRQIVKGKHVLSTVIANKTTFKQKLSMIFYYIAFRCNKLFNLKLH
ncbi:MAG: glycosyltransferase family 2 protein [Bacillota bacterium]|nr:glycosyltransferase family 2 protein [Bacillota bacterium]